MIRACVFEWGELRVAVSIAQGNLGIPRLTKARFPASTGRQPEADKFAIGYVYNFSKRTALYATVAYLNNKNGAGLIVGGPDYFSAPIGGFAPVPDKSYGYDLGMRVSF